MITAIRKKISTIILTLTVAIFLPIILSSAQTSLDFKVPQPPESKLLHTKLVELANTDVQTVLYTSREDEAAILEYYQQFFSSQGFEAILDKQRQTRNKRLLRFKKDDLVVSIALLSKLEETEVVVAKYLQPEGAPPIEELKPSLKDSMFALPKEDCEGEDLDIIPRPPDSVRLLSLDRGNMVTLSYATSLFVEEARDFYKLNMPYQGWEIKQEMAAADGLNAYKRTTGKSSLGVKAPFEGFNVEQVIRDSYLLEFYGRFGRANITILPNFMDRESGSMVQINYSSGD